MECALGRHGTQFINQGHGGETSHHTAARIGALPLSVKVEGGVLPPAGAIRLQSNPLDQGSSSLKPFAGVVAGVEATVRGTDSGVWMARRAPGAPVPVDNDPFIPSAGTALRAHDSLLWTGKNDLTHGATADEVVLRVRRTVEWLRGGGTRVALIGVFTSNDADSAVRERVLAINAALDHAFGEHYIDVQQFLTSEELSLATGLPFTDEDLADIAAGSKPMSLSTDASHLDQVGNHAVAARITLRLSELGWFGAD